MLRKKRPKGVARGIFKMARAKCDHGLIALGWMDNRPVYFLSSQVLTKLTTIQRREKNGDVSCVPCPELVVWYQKFMTGVDDHDQLRLQSYSLQLANRYENRNIDSFSLFNRFFGRFLGLESITSRWHLVYSIWLLLICSLSTIYISNSRDCQ